MNVFVLILIIAWCVRIVSNILSYINLWFVKEYRFDRMLIHLKTSQGKRILFIPFRRPPLSPKTVALFIVSSISLGYFFLLLPYKLVLRMFIIDIATFPVISFFVFVLKIPTRIYHELVIRLAIGNFKRHATMNVIGITGSFGKTSTKQFLSTILSTKYKVLRTEASKNSPIAIAETILKDLRPEHKIFIVEMGAYKQGEISHMTRMVNPQIGIITAVNAQHQDLFGTIEATMKAKYELINGLMGKKIAIVNYDNVYTRQMIKWALKDHMDVWVYSTNESGNKIKHRSDKVFTATDSKADLAGLSFAVSYGNEKRIAKASVVGEHQISNILAAIAGAVASGMAFSDAVRAVRNIKPVPKVMDVQKGINGSTFVNDTSNNNPDAALAALQVLGHTSGKKYLVFQPMIELGSYAVSSHEEVGMYAGGICSKIFLTNPNFYAAFQKGVRRSNASLEARIMSTESSAEMLRSILEKGDTVLFKGKEAEAVFQKLVN